MRRLKAQGLGHRARVEDAALQRPQGTQLRGLKQTYPRIERRLTQADGGAEDYPWPGRLGQREPMAVDDPRYGISMFTEMDRQSFPGETPVGRHANLSRRIGFVFGCDNGFWHTGRPIHRPEIPITAKTREALPVDPICRPTCQAIKRKTDHLRRCVLVSAGGPSGFVSA